MTNNYITIYSESVIDGLLWKPVVVYETDRHYKLRVGSIYKQPIPPIVTMLDEPLAPPAETTYEVLCKHGCEQQWIPEDVFIAGIDEAKSYRNKIEELEKSIGEMVEELKQLQRY